jgi:hypothetical protein
MKTNPNNFARASALQISFSVALIFVFAILLAIAAVQPRYWATIQTQLLR